MSRLRILPVLALGAFALLLSGCGGSNALDLISSGYGGICWLLHVIFVVIAFVEISKSSYNTGTKVLWAAAVFLFPVLGLIAWWFWGKNG